MVTNTENESTGSRTVRVKQNRIKSVELLGTQKDLIIIHNNEDYKLRQTSNGKLILTK